MSVMEFLLFSVALKTSSTLSVFNNFAWLLLLYEQSSIAWNLQTEKKIEFHVISLLQTKSQQKYNCLGKLFQVLMKFISKTFPKKLS